MKIGILHPGKMGTSLGVACQEKHHQVFVALDGRSEETRQRATNHNFTDLGSIDQLCKTCDVVISICMGAGVFPNAEKVINCGFKGIYVDANFVGSIKEEKRLADLFNGTGIEYIEGSIYGWPYPHHDEVNTERTLYLTGMLATHIAELFNGGIFKTVITDNVSSAKTLKRKREDMDRQNLMPHTDHGCGVIEFHDVLEIDNAFVKQWLERRSAVEPSDYTVDADGYYVNRGGYRFTPDQINNAPIRYLNLTPEGCPKEDIEFHERLERAMFDCINCYSNIFPVVKDCLWWRSDAHVAVYGYGAGMGVHHDTAVGGGAENENPLFNVVSGSLILVDQCDGGELSFLFNGKRLKPVKGSAIFYASGYMGAHSVEPIISGTRVSYLEFFGHGKKPGQTKRL